MTAPRAPRKPRKAPKAAQIEPPPAPIAAAPAPAPAPLTILEALDDPDLFAPHFKGESWKAWRAFLAALFGLPMDAEALEIYQRHTGRTAAPTEAFTEAALIVGRRGGKSRKLALIAVFLATLRDYSAFLAPGEDATVAVLAATRKQARRILSYCKALLTKTPLLAGMLVDDNTEEIRLSNGVVIEVSAANFRNVRSATLIAALADEIAFWRTEETSANPDAEILRALKPGLASIPGGILLLASSPYAKTGELYAYHRRYHGRDDADVLVWQADTASMNPTIRAKFLAREFEKDPESAAAEYGAQFRDDLADFLTPEAVEGVTVPGRAELAPEPGITYAAFVDTSGGIKDRMTLAIAHRDARGVGILDTLLEVKPPFNPERVVEQCAGLLRRYGVSRVRGDRYAGQWPVARFAEHGITFEQTARPRSEIYLDFLPLVTAQRVELLDLPRIGAQLAGLVRRTAGSGRESVNHKPGAHDDAANSVAGVLVGLDLDRRPSLTSPSDLTIRGEPVPLPARADAVYAVVWVNDEGAAAVLYAAHQRYGGIVPVTLLDFDSAGMSSSIWSTTHARLRELMDLCRAPAAALFVPPILVPHALAAGVIAEPIPADLDPRAVALSVAAHVSAGKVKIAALVDDKAKQAPFRGALDFRAGDATGDPLRAAAITAVALALIDVSTWSAAA